MDVELDRLAAVDARLGCVALDLARFRWIGQVPVREQVSLSASYARRYPDQCSGGERQRVAIARALISKPSVLICDEITSALDVSVQAAIVELLGELQRELGLSMVFVTHNLPLVRSIAQKVAVLADGSIVEYGETAGCWRTRSRSTRGT